ncbi:MAG: DUF2924 domain-containing protein [Alphaproteobacteria bacterium]|nr:DUF2924 domain-containing protein [Alphaproteobacteria bacterium]
MHAEIIKLSLAGLRQMWVEAWGVEPHLRIGRTMLEKSLVYKLREQRSGGVPDETGKRLRQLVKSYKRNPECFDQYKPALKPGTRLVRNWNGNRYSVLVLKDGEYEYRNKIYTSLSQIASDITGTRWNGWVFFGFKSRGGKK